MEYFRWPRKSHKSNDLSEMLYNFFQLWKWWGKENIFKDVSRSKLKSFIRVFGLTFFTLFGVLLHPNCIIWKPCVYFQLEGGGVVLLVKEHFFSFKLEEDTHQDFQMIHRFFTLTNFWWILKIHVGLTANHSKSWPDIQCYKILHNSMTFNYFYIYCCLFTSLI